MEDKLSRNAEKCFTVFLGQLEFGDSVKDADAEDFIRFVNSEIERGGYSGWLEPVRRSAIKTKSTPSTYLHFLSTIADLATIAGVAYWALPNSVKRKITPEYIVKKAQEWRKKANKSNKKSKK